MRGLGVAFIVVVMVRLRDSSLLLVSCCAGCSLFQLLGAVVVVFVDRWGVDWLEGLLW